MRRIALLLALAPAAGAGAELDADAAKAVAEGVRWLRSRQAGDGSWGSIGETGDAYAFPAGPTALALWTLLKSGVAPDDPQVKRGFSYLERYYRVPLSTYETAVLMLAIEARINPWGPGRDAPGRARARGAEKEWLQELHGKLVKECADGGWRYGGNIPGPHGIPRDVCHSHFAALALLAAHRAGVRAPKETAAAIATWILEEQEPKGPRHARFVDLGREELPARPVSDEARGWAYAKTSPSAYESRTTGAMTSAGLVTLLCADALLRDTDPRAHTKMKERIEKGAHDGLAWLDLHWTVKKNPPEDDPTGYHLLHLLGLERVGDLRGVERIGHNLWWDAVADWLVRHQNKDGSWLVADTHAPHDLLCTCFSLHALSRSALSYGTAD